MIGWGPLHWWARTVSNRRHLRGLPAAGRLLTPPLPSTDSYCPVVLAPRSFWHGSGTLGLGTTGAPLIGDLVL
jgi:hypothetical protein